MKNKLIPALILLFFYINVQAKEYDHTVQGRVVDNMTDKGMDSIQVTLMTSDSTIIEQKMAFSKENGEDCGMYQFTIRKVGKYIIKASCHGYDNGYTDFELRSNRQITIFPKRIRLTKAYHELPEVRVNATKIKMVMKGDTIVYNADAFNLAEGSMLDALISRLPGAKLTKDGQIYVNGKYIQNLLVNGQEFFSGNPKLALENLPAYTVHKIKVFNKDGAASRMMGKDMGDKTYVMDVRLKKEYEIGYLGNMEGGLGTNKRYMAKAFGLKFSDKERLIAFTNINNLNDNQRAALSGEWSPQDVKDGLLATKTAGITYVRFLGSQFSWVGSENIWTHNDTDHQSNSYTQTFLPGSDAFQKNQNKAMSSSDTWSSSFSFAIQEGKYYTINYLTLSYFRQQGSGNNMIETSDSQSVLNKMLTKNSVESKDLNLNFTTNNGKSFIADILRYNIETSYQKNTQTTFSLNDLQYENNKNTRDYRNNYRDQSNQHLDLKGNISYEILWPDKGIRPEYQYQYIYNNTSNMLYRLDKLQGIDSTRFDLLPSSREALLHVMDLNNSFSYKEYQNHHRFLVELTGSDKWIIGRWSLKLPLHLVHKNLFYDRLGRHDVSKQSLFFEPSISARGGGPFNWELNANITSDIPDLTDMVDFRDDSDPLFITQGNPNLKNIHRYDATLSTSKRYKHQQMWSVNLGYHKQDNAVAQKLRFDKETGISQLQPVSVNGNWRTENSFNYTMPLDSAAKWNIDNQLSLNYNHNVDMATVNGYTESQRSIVNNWQMGDNLKLNFRPNDSYEFSLHGGGNYYLINSKRDGFSNIHAGDYNIGMNAQISLPWKLQITTDITMFARRGYQQQEMNTTDWVWNAQINRSFLKGKLLAKLQGFDILQQLSNTKYMMNEQGRTETWHNSIPRYVMLSLAWKFNVTPQRQ